MNTTIDLKTAKTIEAMNQKIRSRLHFQIRCPVCTYLTCSLVCAAVLECGWRCT